MSITLVHLSDTHFGKEDKSAVEAAVALAHDLKPSLTLVTGDITLAGRRSEFLAARAWLDRLPQPVLATPGNHDTPYYNLVLRSVSPFARWRRYIGADDSAFFESAELSAAAINSARGAQPRANWALGVINLAAIGGVAERLAKAGDRLRVFACHHPLIDVQGAAVSGGVRQGRAATQALAAAGVDLILTGHVHDPFAMPLPVGDGCSYMAGAGTLSRRSRGAPPSFSVITASEESLAVVVQAWTGADFETFRTWTFPRRGAGERTLKPPDLAAPRAPAAG